MYSETNVDIILIRFDTVASSIISGVSLTVCHSLGNGTGIRCKIGTSKTTKKNQNPKKQIYKQTSFLERHMIVINPSKSRHPFKIRIKIIPQQFIPAQFFLSAHQNFIPWLCIRIKIIKRWAFCTEQIKQHQHILQKKLRKIIFQVCVWMCSIRCGPAGWNHHHLRDKARVPIFGPSDGNRIASLVGSSP